MSSTAFPGILTASGREVTINDGVPSMTDIALALSRQPRFGGHTRRWWTVIDHSLFCEELAERYAEDHALDDIQSRALRVAALLHDAHEALTADVPSPFKSFGLRVRQSLMDKRIFAQYFAGGYDAFKAFEPIVKEIDRRALIAEAHVVGPAVLDDVNRVKEYFGASVDYWDACLLEIMLEDGEVGSDPSELRKGVNSTSVQTFTSLYLTLR